MGTKTDAPKALKEANAEAGEALHDCDKLLERSAFLLKRSKPDKQTPE